MTVSIRLALLIAKLVAKGVTPLDATAWTVVASDKYNKSSRAKYTYHHPVFGQFGSLAAAKDAHLVSVVVKAAPDRKSRLVDGIPLPPAKAARLFLPTETKLPSMILSAGSVGAMRMLTNASWHGGSAADEKTAVDPSFAHKLDVVVVHAVAGRRVPDAAWHMHALQQHMGFTAIHKSSAVVDAESGRVMVLFLTGHDLPGLDALSRRLPDLHERLHGTVNANNARKGIHMFGYRWNSQGHCNHACRDNMRTGYYPCSSLSSAHSIWRGDGGRMQEAVVGSAAAICELERMVSPSMAERRTAHATASGHPGIWPGTPHDVCPAPTLGVSRAYVSLPHVDHSFADLAETIAWSSKGVPDGSGFCFAVSDAGVVFDLLAHEGTMCIVPGSVMHGTPRLSPGFPSDHSGIGMVVLNKANLLSAEAKADTREITARLTESGNPFVQRFYVSDPNSVSCKVCGRGDRAAQLLLCDNCHLGYHRSCCSVESVATNSTDEWLCHACARF